MRYANEVLNHLPPEGIRAYQEDRLLRQLRYVHDNSAFYRERFEQVGVRVEDIRSLEDFQRMPILMDKEQERISQARSMETMGHPYGAHICSDPRDVAVTATTSGTTGLPTFTYTLGHADLDLLAPAMELMMGQAGIGPGDRMLFAHALGIYATSAALPPLRRAGILPIDVDVRGGAEMILQSAQMTQPAGAMTTPSLALHLIERIPEVLGISPAELGWRALFLVGEIGVGIPSVKRTLEEAYGCRVYDWIAPAGETVGFSCDSEQYHGMHVVTPDNNLYPLDLVDPETRRHLPIEDGVEGEAVYTSLRPRPYRWCGTPPVTSSESTPNRVPAAASPAPGSRSWDAPMICSSSREPTSTPARSRRSSTSSPRTSPGRCGSFSTVRRQRSPRRFG